MKQLIKNYEDYINLTTKNITTNSYGLIQTCGLLSVSDTCKVIADWCPEIRKYRCRIVKLRKNGNAIFAEVKWLGSGEALYKKYGYLWNIDELVKI